MLGENLNHVLAGSTLGRGSQPLGALREPLALLSDDLHQRTAFD
jgi:hypothetical protein